MSKAEAILVELLRAERFSCLLAGQCYADGYCARLSEELNGLDTDFWPVQAEHGACHPDRCPMFYRFDKCQRTAPLYADGYTEGRAAAERWLREWREQHAIYDCNGPRRCAASGCDKLLTHPKAMYCSPACRQRAYRERKALQVHP